MLGCSYSPTLDTLPYLGPPSSYTLMEDGVRRDTIQPHSIADFVLTNQYKKRFGSNDLKGKVYLTEFFFTSCPSVCPKVAKQMQAIHKELSTEPNFALVSVTLDGKRDTPSRLYDYAEEKEGNDSNWYFLSGEREEVYDLASDSYFVAAYQDTTRQTDNIMHDGIVVLVDQQGHVRGMFDGKEAATVGKVKEAVALLLN